MDYKTEIPVTKDQYDTIMKKLSGYVAGRLSDEGQHYVKVMVYLDDVEPILRNLI